MNRHQMAQLFGRDVKTIGKHIANALKEELADLATTVSPHRETSLAVVAKSKTVRAIRCPVVAKFATTAVDGKEIFWTGASLKDADRLTFAAAKMGGEIIPGLLTSIRKATTERREYGNGKPTKSRKSGRRG